jgi:kumamolisin
MKIRCSTASFVMASTLFACCAGTGFAQSARPGVGRGVIIPNSSIARPGDAGKRAHTNIQIKATAEDFKGVTPQTAAPPYPGYLYQTPASIACAYKLVKPVVTGCDPNVVTNNPGGGSKAIAVVDAYDDPDAAADLSYFSTQFGLPYSSSSFQPVYAPHGGSTPGSCTGSATQPASAATYGWDVEESLDVQWAHAMAPGATLYLVEAQSSSYADLFCAVTVARTLVHAAGGGEVSMSWGSGEFSGETSYDSVFTAANVVYFASTGDTPGVEYPSASPNVVAVGGTSLSYSTTTDKEIKEDTWQETGGGLSAVEPVPSFQSGIAIIVGGRGVPDVAADANPYTGVWVYDTLNSSPGWYIVGGTSLASPLWAGIANAAGNFYASTSAEHTALYGALKTAFHDITLGSCGPYMGYFAGPAWDFCSGRGSPETYTDK